MKENNEKNKDEKEKNRRAEIVTRESLGAVGVVFPYSLYSFSLHAL
ncbi:MAG: hypothetical protein ACLS4Z_10585 [Christensenellaceae bacterium]